MTAARTAGTIGVETARQRGGTGGLERVGDNADEADDDVPMSSSLTAAPIIERPRTVATKSAMALTIAQATNAPVRQVTYFSSATCSPTGNSPVERHSNRQYGGIGCWRWGMCGVGASCTQWR